MPQKSKEDLAKREEYLLRPVRTPEAEEQQCISLATNLAKKQLLEGTASSQVITHYLKLATRQTKLEEEKLELEKQLLKARTDALEATRKTEAIYKEAMEAFKSYSGGFINEQTQKD